MIRMSLCLWMLMLSAGQLRAEVELSKPDLTLPGKAEMEWARAAGATAWFGRDGFEKWDFNSNPVRM